jgi:putative ABC transport system permease protein
MRFPFVLAWWEGRSSIRRVGLYMLSITLGVAALVSIHSFRSDVQRSIQLQSQRLLGADIVLRAERALPDSVLSLTDSLEAAGHPTSSAITVPSMVLAPSSGLVRLLQVRGVTGGWPLYGGVVAVPEGAWGRHMEAGKALVDAAVLTQLGMVVGDSLVIGTRTVEVVGVVRDLPTDVGFATAIGPRVYVASEVVENSGIMGFGSMARYTRFFVVPEASDRETIRTRYESVLEATSVTLRTAEEQAEDLTESIGYLAEFLSLVGLAALLLGGIGVGSAIHVFVKERITEVAILRCLGARQGGVFTAYLLQAGALGFLGAAAGAALGAILQQALPELLSGLLPVDVEPRFSALTVLAGIGIGVWVALIFALLPLLTIRDVPPLGALRQDFEEEVTKRRFDPIRWLAVLGLAASVLVLSILEAPSPRDGAAFAGFLGLTTLLLWVAGLGTIRAARWLFPAGAPYVVRQGFSNLFRPRNQTVAVILAMGFGVFVIGTIVQVQGRLVQEFQLEEASAGANLLLFDVQTDQTEGILDLLPPGSLDETEGLVPLISSRLVAINGVGRQDLEALEGEGAPETWALRREYRHTYRGDLTDAEELVAGRWWEDAAPSEPGVARISMDIDLASELGVDIGDRITWDVSGIDVESEIVSLRRIDWAQFRTNFFVVFEPGPLDEAPATWVALAAIPEEEPRNAFQRDLVRTYPNVSVLDITRVRETLGSILGQVDRAVRFLAGFSALAGLLVLVGTLASSRQQRQREGALLKTLGARRRQVLSVLLTEYLALGGLAAITGLILATAASSWVLTEVFQLDFGVRLLPLLAIWLAVSLLTLVTGVVGSRDLLRRPPLPVLRGE